jgi:hypothetical protein
MAPSIQAIRPTARSGKDCGPLSCENPREAVENQVSTSSKAHSCKVFPEIELGDASKSSPRGSGSDQNNTQNANSFSLTASTGVHHLGRLLPDTQENLIDNAAISDKELLAETQSNVANTFAQKEISVIALVRSDSQLPDTQINVVPSSCTHNGDGVRLDDSLPDTQTNTPQSVSPVLIPTVTSLSDPQIKNLDDEEHLLPETQCNIADPTNTSPIVNNSIQNEKDLPDTQLSSSGRSRFSENDDLFLQDMQCNTSSLANLSSIADASVYQVQNYKCLPDPQISSACQSPSSSSTSATSVETGIGRKSPSLQTSPPKLPFNKVTCRERKRIIVSSNRPPALTKAMCQWVDKTNYMLDPFRDNDECWFHPSPPAAHLSMNGILRPCGKLQKRFIWQDRNGKHTLVLNYGIASKLVNYKMTKQQKDGFINKQWHLSHLCGNWTCLNPAHTTVEPGSVNISRNNCFSHRSGCFHSPQCMKDKKVSLGADGKLVDHSASMFSDVGPNAAGDWDDWSIQGFDDGDASTTMVDFESSKSLSFQNGEQDSFSLNDDAEAAE